MSWTTGVPWQSLHSWGTGPAPGGQWGRGGRELQAVGTHTRAWWEGSAEHYGPVTGEAGSCLSLSCVLCCRPGPALAKAVMGNGGHYPVPILKDSVVLVERETR